MIKLLIVDDESGLCEYLRDFFGPKGYQVSIATSAQEALAFVERETPELVLLDINMPGINGFEVIKHLKEDKNTCDIPIVVLTGTYISEDDKKHGLTLGVAKYLTKPFSADDLVKEIKGAFHV